MAPKDTGHFIDMIIRSLICFIDCVELFVQYGDYLRPVNSLYSPTNRCLTIQGHLPTLAIKQSKRLIVIDQNQKLSNAALLS